MTGVEIAAIATVAATMAQGVSEFQTAKANEKISNQNAVYAGQSAAENERRFRVQSMLKQGTQRAAAGGNAIDSLDLLESNAMQDELDALTIRHQGIVESTNYRNQGRQYKRQATGAVIKAFAGSGTALMTAGASGAFGQGATGTGAANWANTQLGGSYFGGNTPMPAGGYGI